MEAAYVPPGGAEADSVGSLGRGQMPQFKLQPVLDDLAQLARLCCQATWVRVVLVDEHRHPIALSALPTGSSGTLAAGLEQRILQQTDVQWWPSRAALAPAYGEDRSEALPMGFMASTAIRAMNQQVLGYIVVAAEQVREVNLEQRAALQALARQARGLLEEHRQALTLQRIKRREARFLQLISQDLKKPFSAILGFSAALQEVATLSDSQLQQVLNRIHGAAQSAYAILNHLLLWARYELGAFTFSPRWLQLSDILDNILPAYQAQAAAKGVDIEVQSSQDMVIYADWRMALSIISHILDNGIKYSQRGGRVELSLHADTEANTIRISDHGTGISAERMAQLFHLSSEQCCEGTAGERGTGLGLPLSQDFIQWHGGEIHVSSTVGQGSRLDLVFPNPDTSDLA